MGNQVQDVKRVWQHISELFIAETESRCSLSREWRN
nr:MAG TPA: hypothetical protein [Caudoviricetes sp.]